jgi:hypothetical protein
MSEGFLAHNFGRGRVRVHQGRPQKPILRKMILEAHPHPGPGDPIQLYSQPTAISLRFYIISKADHSPFPSVLTLIFYCIYCAISNPLDILFDLLQRISGHITGQKISLCAYSQAIFI